jgi:hypothetical protein
LFPFDREQKYGLFAALDASVLDARRSAGLDELTPIKALNLLAALQRQLK